MRVTRALILLLGALAVLALGGVGGYAPPAMAATPCHGEVTPHASHDGGQAPAEKPMKVMGCCVACVAAALPRPTEAARVARPEDRPVAGRSAVLTGRRPTPEPAPPRG